MRKSRTVGDTRPRCRRARRFGGNTISGSASTAGVDHQNSRDGHRPLGAADPSSAFGFQRIDYGPASSYAARSHAVSCRSTCAGAVSRTCTCQRFADVCSRFSTRGLRMSPADFNVRTSDERRVAMPANAVCRTKWIEVFFVSSATGPNVRATSTTRRYVASTEGSFVAKCDLTLMQTDSS